MGLRFQTTNALHVLTFPDRGRLHCSATPE